MCIACGCTFYYKKLPLQEDRVQCFIQIYYFFIIIFYKNIVVFQWVLEFQFQSIINVSNLGRCEIAVINMNAFGKAKYLAYSVHG